MGDNPTLRWSRLKGCHRPDWHIQACISYTSNMYSNGVRTEPEQHTIVNQVREDKTLKGLRIATINVTSWSPKIRRMVTNMSGEFDILLIQEHHKLRRKDMNTGPYVLAAFAPAQKTVPTQDGRGWHTSGGVAILVKPTLYYEEDRFIPQQGLNWAAIKIRLRKHPQAKKNNLGNSLNIIKSYTKHGNEYEALVTFRQVQNYVEQYTCPYVWGGDYNRTPSTLVEESRNRFMAIRTHAPNATSTCSVGGLIDYFVTHEHEHQILDDIEVIKDTVVTPHCPVAATIREDIYIYVKGPATGRGT